MPKLADEKVLVVLNHLIWKTIPEIKKELNLGVWLGVQVYANLWRLEQAGLIEWRWRQQPRKRRVEYRLTPAGTEKKVGLTEVEAVASGIPAAGLAH